MGDFREKYPATDFERKKARKEIPGKNNILHWKKYYSWRIMLKKEKKSFTVYMWGKKFSTPEVWEKIITSTKSPIHPSPTNVQWSCQPFRGWGKKRIWHLSKCHPSTKWLARVHHVVVFKTKVLHFKIENTPINKTQMERESSMECSVSFLWANESLSVCNCLSNNSTADHWLVLNQPRQRGFWRNLRYILYSMV